VRNARITGTQVTSNGEAGLVIERGSQLVENQGNLVERNANRQVWQDAVFPTAGEEVITPPIPAPPE